MRQNETSSVFLLREILSDLRKNVWNYSNEYTFFNENDTNLYSGEVARLKELAEQAILDKEYKKALTYYSHANHFIGEEEYRFDVQIRLLKSILNIVKYNYDVIVGMLEHYKNLAIVNKDEVLYTQMEKTYISVCSPSIEEVLKEINTLIPMDMNVAISNVLEMLSKRDVFQKYSYNIEYVRAKNIECILKENMGQDNATIEKIQSYFESECYDKVLSLSDAAFQETNDPVFLYYLGKAYYKLGQFDLSLHYFLQYKQVATSKYHKVQLYLFHIYKIQHKYSQAYQVMSELSHIESLYFDFSFEYGDYIPYNYVNNRFRNQYDSKSSKVLSKIHMNEEDFLKRD